MSTTSMGKHEEMNHYEDGRIANTETYFTETRCEILEWMQRL
jgi:hypothetical protein